MTKKKKTHKKLTCGLICIRRSSSSRSPFSTWEVLPPIAVSSVLLVTPPVLPEVATAEDDVILLLDLLAPWWLVAVPSTEALLISFWLFTKFRNTCNGENMKLLVFAVYSVKVTVEFFPNSRLPACQVFSN